MGLINVLLITRHVDNECVSAPFLIQSVFSNKNPSQLMCFWLDVSSALTKKTWYFSWMGVVTFSARARGHSLFFFFLSIGYLTSSHLCAWEVMGCLVRQFGWSCEKLSAGKPLERYNMV